MFKSCLNKPIDFIHTKRDYDSELSSKYDVKYHTLIDYNSNNTQSKFKSIRDKN